MPRNSVRNVAPAKRPSAGTTGNSDLAVIIAAAGSGKNMRSIGVRSLIPLKGRQLLIDKQIESVRAEYPESEIVVVVGYEADRLIPKLPRNVRIVENENFETTNVVRSIGMGLRATLATNVLLIYGDLCFNAESIRGVTSRGSAMVVDRHNYIESDEIGVAVIEEHVTNFAYGLPTKWGQIAFATGSELEMLRTICRDRAKGTWCGFEAFNMILEKGGSFRAVENEGAKLAEIDQNKDVEKATKL